MDNHPGYHRVFRERRLSLGLVVPIESYGHRAEASMTEHVERVQLAEKLGFSAVWLRDVPFNVPSFGDAGQLYDPFVYLGLLAGCTEGIALGVASIILPLRHPAHVAKAAASADALSGGRVLLGVASGDRPEEFPAMAIPFESRGERFREAFSYLSRVHAPTPSLKSAFGTVDGGLDLLPKPPFGPTPLLITGGSQQDPEWVARNGDGWMTYPRPTALQARVLEEWRARVESAGLPPKPVMQPLYFDLADDPEAPPQPIHLGFRSGTSFLRDYLEELDGIGVQHVALNLRFNRADVPTTMKVLADALMPTLSN